MTLKTRLIFYLLAASVSVLSCSTKKSGPEEPATPEEPEHKEEVVWGDTTSRAFKVSLSSATKVGYRDNGYRWQAGDIIIVSNCKNEVVLDNGIMKENAEACLVSVTEDMIDQDGTSVSFETNVPSAPQYCIVAASKAKSIVSVSKDGTVTATKLGANSSGILPYIGSCKGSGNSFILETDVPLACFTVTALPVYNVTITQGTGKLSAYVTQHPCVVYFPLENVPTITVKASSVSSTLFTYAFKGVSVPQDGSILDLGDLCAFAGYSDMYDRWQAGLDISIAGKVFNKSSWGSAVHVTHDTLIHNASGVYFINPGAVLSVSGTSGKGLVALSNEEGEPASLDVVLRLEGDVAFKDISFAGSARRMFEYRETADFALFDGCNFQGSDFLAARAGIGSLCFRNCSFFSKEISELNLADCKNLSVGRLSLEENVFYNKIPAESAFVNAASVSELCIRNNILYLDGNSGKKFSIVNAAALSSNISGNYGCGSGCIPAIPDAVPGTAVSGPVTDPFTRKDFAKGIFEYDLNRAIDNDVVARILECRTPEATFCLENEKVHGFINDFVYDTDYSYTRIQDYSDSHGDWQAPLPATISLESSIAYNKQFVLTVSTDGDMAITNGNLSKNIDIYNLKPGKTYSYGVFSSADGTLLRKGAFSTSGTVRQIKTARIRNVRDAGGWTGIGGKKVKYGILFRGAEIKNNSSDLKSVEQEDYQTFVNDLGISLDLDLRGTNERGGIDWSPLGISYLHLPLSPYQWAVQDPNRALYAKGLRALIENARNSNATYVHCQAGADRTGTFVFLVNGLLGVCESDLAKDYEITSYYSDRSRNSDNYKALVNSVLKFCTNGRDINEGIHNAVLSMGITEQEIEELRELMLE